ncbi:PLD-like domain-containing protein [Nocardia amikacinitolerans]|uniref:DISARM system phospholipase D-like protein DrmC n=1 Tax=Nocardia amikacinitolerans TaxID=756689 RepID=UPI0020A276B7|nr:DISARM system phospholipase D-like protein DrmC [Nocardia amikacinitolerans]MCP2298533.1 PLD-like domain-containing protein [Nocardia amikacinitolerans]
MVSSISPADPARSLGELLTGTEAQDLADRLASGSRLSSALRAIEPSRRSIVGAMLEALAPQAVVPVLRAIEGARSMRPTVDPLWTLPGQLARSGRLTSEVTRLVDGARQSITCSTFNFQRSSGFWTALQRAAGRPGVSVRIYLDTRAADQQSHAWSPTTTEVAAHLRPAVVYRTTAYDGEYVRNHAKLLVIDHRFLLVTSANFSRSAEHRNVEFGLFLDNSNLAEAVERQLFAVQAELYEPVVADTAP